jgi:hypothetical protein
MALSDSDVAAMITALETALGSGELTVEYAGRRITYRSAAEIVSALEYFKRRQLGVPASGPAPSSADRGSYAAFERD